METKLCVHFPRLAVGMDWGECKVGVTSEDPEVWLLSSTWLYPILLCFLGASQCHLPSPSALKTLLLLTQEQPRQSDAGDLALQVIQVDHMSWAAQQLVFSSESCTWKLLENQCPWKLSSETVVTSVWTGQGWGKVDELWPCVVQVLSHALLNSSLASSFSSLSSTSPFPLPYWSPHRGWSWPRRGSFAIKYPQHCTDSQRNRIYARRACQQNKNWPITVMYKRTSIAKSEANPYIPSLSYRNGVRRKKEEICSRAFWIITR